jgi:hypothetical protein
MAPVRRDPNARWLFRVGVLTLASALFSVNELRYYAYGKTATAEIRNIGRFVRAKGGFFSFAALGREQRTVEYTYKDEAADAFRTERDQVPNDWTTPKAGTVKVQYIPGEKDASRLAGNHNLIPVAGFAVGLTLTAFFALRWARAHDPAPQKTKKGRRPR